MRQMLRKRNLQYVLQAFFNLKTVISLISVISNNSIISVAPFERLGCEVNPIYRNNEKLRQHEICANDNIDYTSESRILKENF